MSRSCTHGDRTGLRPDCRAPMSLRVALWHRDCSRALLITGQMRVQHRSSGWTSQRIGPRVMLRRSQSSDQLIGSPEVPDHWSRWGKRQSALSARPSIEVLCLGIPHLDTAACASGGGDTSCACHGRAAASALSPQGKRHRPQYAILASQHSGARRSALCRMFAAREGSEHRRYTSASSPNEQMRRLHLGPRSANNIAVTWLCEDVEAESIAQVVQVRVLCAMCPGGPANKHAQDALSKRPARQLTFNESRIACMGQEIDGRDVPTGTHLGNSRCRLGPCMDSQGPRRGLDACQVASACVCGCVGYADAGADVGSQLHDGVYMGT